MEGKNITCLEELTSLENANSSFCAHAQALIEKEELVCVGFVNLFPEPRFEKFETWLTEKKHGEMSYLENYKELRKNPNQILPGAMSAIIIGFPYYQGDRFAFNKELPARIAQYARVSDYHKVLKKKCERVLSSILAILPPNHFGRVLVDSAPILERALAEKTLKGFVGKNTMYIHPQWGSYLLLAEIFLTVSLEEEIINESTQTCGTCSRCQVYCPTGALSPYSLDATKCLAYYTIEHRGLIPIEYWKYLKKYVFGCDICQLVCPFNRHVSIVKNITVKIAEFPPLFDVATMDANYYEKTFGGTPMTRAKRSGLRRNALIAMVVSKDEKLEEAIYQIKKENDPLLLKTIEQISEYRSLYCDQ